MIYRVLYVPVGRASEVRVIDTIGKLSRSGFITVCRSLLPDPNLAYDYRVWVLPGLPRTLGVPRVNLLALTANDSSTLIVNVPRNRLLGTVDIYGDCILGAFNTYPQDRDNADWGMTPDEIDYFQGI